jgi:hypothetical protein
MAQKVSYKLIQGNRMTVQTELSNLAVLGWRPLLMSSVPGPSVGQGIGEVQTVILLEQSGGK